MGGARGQRDLPQHFRRHRRPFHRSDQPGDQTVQPDPFPQEGGRGPHGGCATLEHPGDGAAAPSRAWPGAVSLLRTDTIPAMLLPGSMSFRRRRRRRSARRTNARRVFPAAIVVNGGVTIRSMKGLESTSSCAGRGRDGELVVTADGLSDRSSCAASGRWAPASLGGGRGRRDRGAASLRARSWSDRSSSLSTVARATRRWSWCSPCWPRSSAANGTTTSARPRTTCARAWSRSAARWRSLPRLCGSIRSRSAGALPRSQPWRTSLTDA